MHRIQLGLITLLFCSASSLADKFECKTERAMSPYQLSAPAGYEHARFIPYIPSTKTKSFAAFTAIFDDNDDDNGDGEPDLLGNPAAVAYELKGVRPSEDGQFQEPDISIKRPGKWYRDPDLAFMWEQEGVSVKGLDRSYAGVGSAWNRGHLAMSDHAQRISAEASCNTHTFWNASPQAANLNQGDWRFLENYSAALSNMVGRVWVVTGPIFEKDKEIGYIGSTGEVPVAVPHAFYKILFYQKGNQMRWFPFIFRQDYSIDEQAEEKDKFKPNADWVKCNQAKKKRHRYDLNQYLVTISDIEKATGHRFISDVPDETRNKIINFKMKSITKVPEKYWDKASFCGDKSLQF